MAIGPGTRIGPYEVTALIGEGGMGQVWRARHTSLRRDDALKVLPAAFAGDAGRLARFGREAQMLASLNHPNIAHVYGLETVDGSSAIVMELVDGPTLDERIAGGRIELAEALTIAVQIAEALEAAHDQGIIHRDLKPANVKVRPDGTVKVLDFGLAKEVDPGAAPRTDIAEMPTNTAASPEPSGMTRAGVVLGTASYMSPEQARARPLDTRTDIWSFGCVLFELLTRRRAFPGRSADDARLAVLEREPDWTLLPADTPAAVMRVLHRCLQKDRSRRLRHIGDARLDLVESLTAPTPEMTPATRGSWVSARVLATAAMLAAVSGAAGWWVARSGSEAPARDVLRMTIELDPELWGSALAVSPDGSLLAYSGTDPDTGRGMLFLRRLDALVPQPVAGTDNAMQPFFSPDGSWIGFIEVTAPSGGYAPPGRLRKVAVSGGPPVTLADALALGASWGADDAIVFTAETETGPGLFRVPASGGTPERLTTPRPDRGELRHGWPEHAPGGEAIVFSVTGQPTFNDGHISVLMLETGEHRPLVEQGYHARVLPTGHLVYVVDGSLMALRFDASGPITSGTPVRLVEGLRTNATSGHPAFGVSDGGLLVYATPREDVTDRALAWVTPDGRATPVLVERDPYMYPRLSPNGRRLAVGIDDDTGRDIWFVDLERATRTRVTSGDRGIAPPPITDWTPDGRLTLNRRLAPPATTIEVLDAVSGTSTVMLRRPTLIAGPSWSPDGRSLAFFQFEDATNRDLWVLEPGGDARQLLATPAMERGPRFSPDGRWIAYVSNTSGRDEVYVRPYPGPGEPVPVSTQGGAEPVWSRDGRGLFYRAGDRLMAVPIGAAPAPLLGQARVLFEAAPYLRDVGLGIAQYDVAADGRFIMVAHAASAGASAIGRLTVVSNWFAELARLLPAD